MPAASREEVLRDKYTDLECVLNERTRRLWAATEAKALGRGGQSLIAQVTRMARSTIYHGLQELRQDAEIAPADRVRRPGGGRKSLLYHQPRLLAALEALVESTSRGDPELPLRWTCKSVRQLTTEWQEPGYRIGRQKVSELLAHLGYSLQANSKTKEGASHPDRNARCEHISAQVQAFQERNQPVVSVDTKKKERVGDFKNGGREWHPVGEPERVRVHDFADRELGKAIPYGVYDLTTNEGWE
jgi:transposase